MVVRPLVVMKDRKRTPHSVSDLWTRFRRTRWYLMFVLVVLNLLHGMYVVRFAWYKYLSCLLIGETRHVSGLERLGMSLDWRD